MLGGSAADKRSLMNNDTQKKSVGDGVEMDVGDLKLRGDVGPWNNQPKAKRVRVRRLLAAIARD
jgi:hypothetical protein